MESLMKVYIKGVDNSALRKEIYNATHFFAGNLLSNRLKDKLTIWVELLDTIKMKKKIIGSAYWLDDNKRPREFKVEILKNQPKSQLLKTLAHEMVHVSQFAKGELVDLMNGSQKFMGSYISEDLDYFFTPHEVIAYGMEVGLYAKWKEFQKSQKKFLPS